MTKIALACAALTVAGLVTFTAIPGAAEEHGEKHAEHPKETPKVVVKTEGHDAMPAGTKGATDGVILAKDHGKVILHTADGNLLFAPNWVGGAPKDGGGLDKEMLATLEKFKVGDKVHITWTWNERRRIETISAVK